MEQPPAYPENEQPEPEYLSTPDSTARHAGVWAVLLLFAGFYAVLQMWGSAQMAELREGVSPQLQLSGRYAVGAFSFQKIGGEAMGQVGAQALLEQLEDTASSAADQVLMTPVVGELAGAEEALAHLDAITETPETLKQDQDLLRAIYAEGASSLDAATREGLIERHGWLAKLALSHGAESSDPLRREVMNAARLTFMAAIGIVGVIGLLGFAGVILLIVAAVSMSKGRLVFRYPTVEVTRRLPFLEVMTLFMVVFGLLSLVAGFLPSWLAWLPFPISLAAIAWPLARGISLRELLEGLGWTKGQGILRESFFGVLGYMAGIPVVAVGFLLTFVIMSITGATPTHPIADQFEGAGLARFLGLFMLACVAAPIIEETMFRGAFYHYLRGWRGPIFSGLLTGVIFAAIHPQGYAAIPVLASLGGVLAWIREWRGSLIGSMVAHGLNNFIVLSFGMLMVS
jgi:membrane protease YdiL (CAAX protease family)